MYGYFMDYYHKKYNLSTIKFIIKLILIIAKITYTTNLNKYPDSLTKSENLNTIDLRDIDNDCFAVSVSIGYPPQKFQLQLDISSEYTWVGGKHCEYCSFENLYDETASQTAIKPNVFINFEEFKTQIKGEIIFDFINIKIFSANSVAFFIVTDDIYLDGLDGVLGLGYTSVKSEIGFSILDRLFLTNQIQRNIFSLKYSEASAPKLLMGGVPNEIENDAKNFTVCNVDKTVNNWNCKISHLLVGTNVNFYKAIAINKSAMFSTTINLINVPIDNITFFMQNYFQTYPGYSIDFCKVKPEGQKFFIICNMDLFDLNKAPPMHLILNGYAYYISPFDLFEEIFTESYIRYYLFKIVFKHTPNGQWILGHSFMRQYHIVFDKEKGQVGFYSGIKADLSKFTRDSTESVCFYNYFCYFFLVSLVLVSMGYIIYNKKKEENLIANALLEQKLQSKEVDFKKAVSFSDKR